MTTADSQDIEQATATLAYFTALLSYHTRVLTHIP